MFATEAVVENKSNIYVNFSKNAQKLLEIELKNEKNIEKSKDDLLTRTSKGAGSSRINGWFINRPIRIVDNL